MDESVERLTTYEDCVQFAINVTDAYPDLARQARIRAVQLRGATYGAKTQAEREAIEAVYAYEDVLSQKRGKKVRASRTWQMIKRHGILPAVERAVDRSEVTTGYEALVQMGLQDFAFEAVILRHPTAFSSAALRRSEERQKEWAQAQNDKPKPPSS
jgi:hypothetical protein